MELNERLVFARKRKKLSQAQAVANIEMSQPNLSDLEKGKTKGSEHLFQLALTYEVSPNWLINNIGNFDDDFDGKPIKELDAAGVSVWDSDTPLESDELEVVFFKDVSFACGSGGISEALDTETRRLRMSKNTLRRKGIESVNVFCATAHDNSMQPTITDKDIIWVDMGRKNIKDGRIYAIDHGGMFRCKRLYQLPNQGVRIVSDNAEEYQEETLTAEQRIEQNFTIIGWVWSWSHEEVW